MSRKVFISILGMSWYQECNYVKGAFDSGKVRFIQEATLNYLFSNDKWNENDRIFVLLTDVAREKNWTETIVERYNPQLGKEMPYEPLEKRLKNLNSPAHIEGVTIKDGKNEDELWKIFTTMYNLLENEDELYIDITHSFRYLPMLLLVFCNYVKFLKNVNVVHISYGNYDARVDNKAPIVDLLPIISLQNWTIAAADYIRYGNADQIVDLCNMHIGAIFKESKEVNTAMKDMRLFADNLKMVIQERQTCRGINIVESKSVKNLKESCDRISRTLIPPLDPIFEKIKGSLVNYDSSENVMNGFEAARWCYQNGLYQQCLSILYENMITYICFIVKDLKWKNRNQREFIRYALNVANKPECEWENIKENEIIIVRDLISEYPEFKQHSNVFMNLAELRNDFNHAGMRENARKVSKMLTGLKKYLNEILVLVGKEPLC